MSSRFQDVKETAIVSFNTAVPTSIARARLLASDAGVDFVLGTHQLSAAEKAAGIVQIPLFAMGLAFVFNLPDPSLSSPDIFNIIEAQNAVMFTDEVLRGIFYGNITRWSDPVLVAAQERWFDSSIEDSYARVNVSLALEQLGGLALEFVMPGGPSASMEHFTRYMAGVPGWGVAPSDTPAFPGAGGFRVLDADCGDNCDQAMVEFVMQNSGALALVSSSVAELYARDGSVGIGLLPSQNPVVVSNIGDLGLQPWALTLGDAAGTRHSALFEDISASLLRVVEGFYAYPLTVVLSFFSRPLNGSAAEALYRDQLFLDFANWVTAQQGSQGLLSLGVLPSDVVARARRGATAATAARDGGCVVAGESGVSFSAFVGAALTPGWSHRLEAERAGEGLFAKARGALESFQNGTGINAVLSHAPAELMLVGDGGSADFFSLPLGLEGVAVVPVFRGRNESSDGFSLPLTLTMGLLSDILRGSLTQWNDSRLVDLNPQVADRLQAAEDEIRVTYCAAQSGWTNVLLRALLREDPAYWRDVAGYDETSISLGGFGSIVKNERLALTVSNEAVLPDPLVLLGVSEFDRAALMIGPAGFLSKLRGSSNFGIPPAPATFLPRAVAAAGGTAPTASPIVPADLELALEETAAAGGGALPADLSASANGYPLVGIVYALVPRRPPDDVLAAARIFADTVFEFFISATGAAVDFAADGPTVTAAVRLFSMGAPTGAMTRASLLQLAAHVTASGAPVLSSASCLSPDGVVCSNRGTCVRGIGCVCREGFDGTRCETEDDEGGGGAALSAGGIAGVVLGVVLPLCACFCLLLCLLCCAFTLTLAALALLVALVLAAALAAATVVSGGAGVGARRYRRRLKRSYDLTVFEDYEGEEVDDGLERAFRELAFEDLAFEKKIGEGAFGRVFRGRWRGSTVVAIKELNVQADEKAKREFIHEANMMARVGNHPNVVQFLGAVTTEERFYLVTAFAENGSLLDVLRRRRHGGGGDAELIRIALGAALGLGHLHAEGVVHRDVAARNFLVSRDMTIMVADFGLSRVLEDAETAQRTQSNIGPVRWMAPESIEAREFSKASDIWMFGCFLLEISTDRESVPFSDLSVQEVLLAVKNKERPAVPDQAPPVLKDVMRRCWSHSPAERPSIQDIIAVLRDEGDSESSCSTDDEEETFALSDSRYVDPHQIGEIQYSSLREEIASEFP